MLIGIGLDLAELSTWQRALDNPATAAIEGTFTPAEIAYARSTNNQPAAHLAARFAAKEAFIKALGSARAPAPAEPRAFDLREIEVVRDPSGRPSLSLSGHVQSIARAAGVQHHWLSLTHTETTAAAVVILEG